MFNTKIADLNEEIVNLRLDRNELRGTNSKKSEEISKLKAEKKGIELDHKHEVRKLEQKHDLDQKQVEFDTKNATDLATSDLKDTVIKLEKENAELQKENQMLDKLIDLKAGMVDVKALMNTLITKLPEIKINSLSLSNGSNETPKSTKD